MNSNLEQINLIVTKHTLKVLNEQAERLHLSKGEIIDRLLLKTGISDPNLAAVCVCDYLLIIAKNQPDNLFEETILKTSALILNIHAEARKLNFEQEISILKPIYKNFQCKK